MTPELLHFMPSNALLRTSQRGQKLIQRFEGCRLHAYTDIAGIWTIGWGDTENVRPDLQITQEDADNRFAQRLERDFEPTVRAAIRTTPTTQSQFDAMVSLTYNIGGPQFARSSIAKYHREQLYDQAANAFLLYDVVKGKHSSAIAKRRELEAEMYREKLASRLG